MVNIKLFATVSIVLFGFCTIISYIDVISHPDYTINIPTSRFFLLIVESLLSTKIRIISVVCMAFCSLLIFGKLVQLLFFGHLRTDESRKIHDRVLNYILFKIVFSGVILELLGWEDILSCVLWFTVLGFLKIFALLCNDRLSFLLTTANINTSKHSRIFTLLNIIFISNIFWFSYCFYLFETTYDVYLVLTFECFILFLDTTQTIIKYLIFVIFKNHINWESQTKYMYHTELVTDTVGLLLTLTHYCQVLYMHGISFTLIDAVLFLNMRKVFNRLRQKINAYMNYRKLAKAMDSVFPTVKRAEFETGEYDDICLICRDQMETGKKLPCGHVFHESCILSWLEQQNTCPTCREPLMAPTNISQAQQNVVEPPPQIPDDIRPLFHQRRNRFINWIPRVEIRTRPFEVTQQMVDAVQEVVPDVPADTIRQDLAITGSVNFTVSNIIEGRIQIPPEDNAQVNPIPHASRQREMPAGEKPVQIDDAHTLSEEIMKLESSLLPVPSGYGSSASERQKMLAARKKALQQQSKLRYLKKLQERKEKEEKAEIVEKVKKVEKDEAHENQAECNFSNSSNLIFSPKQNESSATELIPFSSEDPVEIRRRRAIEAAERRRQLSSSPTSY